MVHASCLLYRILAAIANAFVKMARISGDSQILLIRHALIDIMAGGFASAEATGGKKRTKSASTPAPFGHANIFPVISLLRGFWGLCDRPQPPSQCTFP
jgi:hypothetical protein